MLDVTSYPYVESIHTASVGGGEEATFIKLTDGKCIVLAFDLIGVYESEQAYWEGDEGQEGLLWMSEE